jgi:hypothetical protein
LRFMTGFPRRAHPRFEGSCAGVSQGTCLLGEAADRHDGARTRNWNRELTAAGARRAAGRSGASRSSRRRDRAMPARAHRETEPLRQLRRSDRHRGRLRSTRGMPALPQRRSESGIQWLRQAKLRSQFRPPTLEAQHGDYRCQGAARSRLKGARAATQARAIPGGTWRIVVAQWRACYRREVARSRDSGIGSYPFREIRKASV